MEKRKFVSLHSHSSMGSPLDGFNTIEDLFEGSKEAGHPGFGLTDHGSMSALYDTWKMAKKKNAKFVPGCLLKGQEIVTSEGVKSIEDIKIGEYVLTHQGRFRKVLSVMNKEYNGLLYSIFFTKTKKPLCLTEEHPILISDNNGETSWKKPGEITFGYRSLKKGNENWNNYVCLPKLKERKDNCIFSLFDNLPKQNYFLNNNLIYQNYWKSTPKWENITFEINEDLAWLLGIYAAEGSVRKINNGEIIFTLNINENDFGQKIKKIIEQYFKLNVSIIKRENKSTQEVKINHIPLSYFLSSSCGIGAHNKKVPVFIYECKKEIRQAFINGLIDGDGKKGYNSALKVCSKDLAWGFRTLLADQGIWSNVAEVNGSLNGKKHTSYQVPYIKKSKWRRSIETEDFVIRGVKNITSEYVKATVYNIEVEEDNSYVSDFILHNCELYFAEDLSPENKKNYHLVVLAQNEVGYRNLLKLNLEAFKNQSIGFMGKGTPRVSWEQIQKYNEGIFALTACSNGIISKKLISDQEEQAAEEIVKRLHSIFKDRFFLEIQPHSLLHINPKTGKEVNQLKLNECLLKYSHDFNIPYVITCDAHYRNKEMSVSHDIMLAIKDHKPVDDPNRFRYGIQDMYFKTEEEIVDFFGTEIAETGMANSMKIFDACELPKYLEGKGPILPKFPVKDEKEYPIFREWFEKNEESIDEDKAYLRYKCIQGFKEKCQDFSPEKKKEYWNRVKKELEVLEMRNFSSYLLIVADYFNWAKEQKIPTGTGRGSVVGSLVAYLTGITKVDPIKHDLLFERFHNREKKAYPDIDLDFSQAKRDLVKQYLKQKYGEDKAASVSNWNTLSPKVVIKDVARSLNIEGDKSASFKVANAITSVMPMVGNIEEIEKTSKKFEAFMKKYPKLRTHALELQGVVRNWATHAAGMVLSDQPLVELVPLRIDEDGNVALQWEKSRTEEFGLVKMDLLGLKTLDVIEETLKLVKQTKGLDINIDLIPDDDEATYKMIGRGETMGVFQLESSLAPLCVKIKPKTIDEISDINALGRPSCSAEQRENYIERKFGRQPIKYLHSNLENALKKTFGISLYEEAMMTVAKDCAGWDLNQSDALRKITKLKGKDPELVEKTKNSFISDSVAFSKMSAKDAAKIWQHEIEPYGSYGFNKAHSVAYSYISYQTAWLKCHHPTEFMCAILNSEEPNSDKLLEYLNGCSKLGLKITPPNLNTSRYNYMITSPKEIATGLSAIKGVGEKALEEILKLQPFSGIEDFLYRTNARVINKGVIQAMAKGGVFETLNRTRKDVFENYEKYRLFVREEIKNGKTIDQVKVPAYNIEWNRKDFLLNEREVYGRTISGSLHEIFKGFFKANSSVTPLRKVKEHRAGDKIKIEVIINSKIKEFTVKKPGKNFGKKFAKYLVEDADGTTTELTLWMDDYQQYNHLLQDGLPMKAICEIGEYQEQLTLSLSTLEGILGKEI